MAHFFLKLKNWQLFIIVFAPVVFLILYNIYYPVGQLGNIFRGAIVFGIIGIICFIWQISIANIFSKKTSPILNTTWFNLFVAYGLLYILFCIIILIIPSIRISNTFEIFVLNPISFFLFLVSFTFTIYQNAKIIRIIELKRSVSFFDCIGVFLSFCIFPLGILLIQPRINRILEMREDDDLINHLIE